MKENLKDLAIREALQSHIMVPFDWAEVHLRHIFKKSAYFAIFYFNIKSFCNIHPLASLCHPQSRRIVATCSRSRTKKCDRQGLCEQYAGKVCTLLFRSSNAFFLESHLVKTGFCFACSDFERILPVRISGGVSAEYK